MTHFRGRPDATGTQWLAICGAPNPGELTQTPGLIDCAECAKIVRVPAPRERPANYVPWDQRPRRECVAPKDDDLSTPAPERYP